MAISALQPALRTAAGTQTNSCRPPSPTCGSIRLSDVAFFSRLPSRPCPAIRGCLQSIQKKMHLLPRVQDYICARVHAPTLLSPLLSIDGRSMYQCYLTQPKVLSPLFLSSPLSLSFSLFSSFSRARTHTLGLPHNRARCRSVGVQDQRPHRPAPAPGTRRPGDGPGVRPAEPLWMLRQQRGGCANVGRVFQVR